jgi:hypothetical protein
MALQTEMRLQPSPAGPECPAILSPGRICRQHQLYARSDLAFLHRIVFEVATK